MADETGNVILEYLRRFDRKLDTAIDDLRDLKGRTTGVEAGLASVQRRIDRVEERLERIERRLELAETHPAQ
jgi:archaellum component FlaC